MPVFDQMVAVGSRQFPRQIIKLLAQAEIAFPAEGDVIPIHIIDKALEGRTFDQRVRAKEILRAYGLIAK